MSYLVYLSRGEQLGVERYRPIAESEWSQLVAEFDDMEYVEDEQTTWTTTQGDEVYFWYDDGLVWARNPGDATMRRLVALAGRLDAWVYGEEGERHHDEDGTISVALSKARPQSIAMPDEEDLDEGDWLNLVRRQDDFRVETSSEVALPAGIRTMRHPELAVWTGHPTAGPIPFFFDNEDVGSVLVLDPDTPTVERMTALAAELGAEVGDPPEL